MEKDNNRNKQYQLDVVIGKMKRGECAIAFKERDSFSLYGQFLDSRQDENIILCRIAGASSLVKDFQTVVSFSKL